MKQHSTLIGVALLCVSVVVGAAPTVSPLTVTAPTTTKPTGKLKLDFREASVLHVIRLIAELTGTNIVATEEAGKRFVSVFLQEMAMQAALDAVCKAAGLWYRKDDSIGVWRVMTLEEYQRDIVVYREEQTRVFTLRNANVVAGANAIAALFGSRVKLSAGVEDSTEGSSGGSGGQSAGGSGAGDGGTRTGSQTLTPGQIASTLEKLGGDNSPAAESRLADSVIEPPAIFVTYNRLHNLLIARSADVLALREVERLIGEFDRPTRQVLLEMKILEVTLGDGLRSAFDIGFTAGGSFSGPDIGQPANPLNTASPLGSLAALGTGNSPLEGGSLVFQLMNERILARLQMLETENKVKVLATPMLLASNNQSARLFVGEERILTTGITANTVTNETQTITTFTAQTEKRNVGNTLEILPRINADHTVTLSITQDSSNVLPKSSTIPVGSGGNIQEFPIDTVNTSNLKVMVIAKDRHSVAVGGMIRERKSEAESKVPIIGDVPGLGNLFKRRVQENSRSELVLVITPYIMDNPQQGDALSREVMQSRAEKGPVLQNPKSSSPIAPKAKTQPHCYRVGPRRAESTGCRG